MLPTKYSVLLSDFKASVFPYFAASYGPLTAIVGGGGDAKTGVPNLLEVYQKDIKLLEFDFETEATFFVQPYDDYLFTAGEKHLTKFRIQLENDKPVMQLVAETPIEEPTGLQIWKNMVILATEQRIQVFDMQFKQTAEFGVASKITAITVNQYAEELVIVVLAAKQAYWIKTGISYNERSPESIKTIHSAGVYKQISFFDDEYCIAIGKNDSRVYILDEELEVVESISTKKPLAVFTYNRQEHLLLVISIDGLLTVLQPLEGMRLKVLCTRQLSAAAFICDVQFYSEDWQFMCLSVDGWERGRIVQENYTKYYFLAVLTLLTFFLGLESIRAKN